MKPKYGDKVHLLATDTDSFIYGIETEDIYKDMIDHKEYYDLSEYSPSHPIYDVTNKKVIGKFKDEMGDCIMNEFFGIRSKCYGYSKFDPKTQTTTEIKKLKGISKSVVKNSISLHGK